MDRARLAAAEYRAAHRLGATPGDLSPPVVTYLALTPWCRGIGTQVLEHKDKMTATDERLRAGVSSVKWMGDAGRALTSRLRSDASVRARLRQADRLSLPAAGPNACG